MSKSSLTLNDFEPPASSRHREERKREGRKEGVRERGEEEEGRGAVLVVLFDVDISL